MANIDGTSGGTGLYNTQIPDIEDAADIQTALQLYHYGSSTIPTTEGDVEANSIAGYIKSLNQQVASLTPDILTVLGEAENLNNKVTAGLYSQDSDTDARSLSSLNYPLFPDVNGLAYAGLLTVTIAESVVYQTYQTFGNANALFFRSRTTGLVWSSWIRVSESTHIHDDRYYTESEINGILLNKQDNISGAATTITGTNLTTSRALISGTSGKVEVSPVTTTELGYVSGVTSGIQSQLGTLTTNVGLAAVKTTVDTALSGKASTSLNNLSSKTTARQNLGIFVLNPTTYPNGPSQAGFTVADGDLWFW